MKLELEIKYKILQTITKYELIKNGDTIVIGVSGGPDSTCLLNILNDINNDNQIKLRFNLVIVHINHMIRKDSYEDEEYVKNMAKTLEIPIYIKREDIVKLAQNQKKGLEETARKVRIDFFEEVLKEVKGNKIVTAHNRNDNAETVVMNIIRGTGISGLKGIDFIRNDKYIKPLLGIERKLIEEYCTDNKLNPKIDYTNKENVYTRNKVRNLLIPYIEENFNPNFLNGIDRLSKLAKEENEYLNKIVEKKYKNILVYEKERVVLDLIKFNNLDVVIKKRIIIYTINKLFGNFQGIEKIHVDDIIKLCFNNVGNKFLIPNKKLKVMVKNKKVFFIKNY